MKKYFSFIKILALLLLISTGLSFSTVSFAENVQSANAGSPGGNATEKNANAGVQEQAAANPNSAAAQAAAAKVVQAPAAAAQATQTAQNAADAKAAAANAGSCTPDNFWNFFTDALSGKMLLCLATTGLVNIFAYLMYYIMSLAGFLLGIVGILFDWLVVITIFQFGAFFGNSAGLLLAWGIIRDIGNIMILFGFIYAGVMMILDLHSFDARKAIPRLIIFAVLLNFSLFAAEAVIDIANVVSAQLYSQAGESTFKSCAGSLSNCGTSASGASQTGIASVLIQDTYVGSGWSFVPTNVNGSVTAGTNPLSALKLFLGYTGATILIVVLMIVLLIASVMLVIRGIALVIIMVLSPIGFAGMAVPQLEGMAKKWWHALLSNAMFAPIFLLMVFVGLKIVDGLRLATASNLVTGAGSAGSVTLASALSNPSTNIGSIFIIYALVIGFFVAALIFSKSSGAAGAAFATSFVQKTARGVTLPGRVIARNTIGGTSKKMGRAYDTKMGQWQNSTGWRKFVAGSAKLSGADEAINNTFQAGQKVQLGTKRDYTAEKEYQKHREDHLTHAKDKAENKKNVNTANELLKSADADERAKGKELLERTGLKMSVDDLVEEMKSNAESMKNLSKVLSTEKINKVKDHKDFGETNKHKAIHHRYAPLHQSIDKSGAEYDDGTNEIQQWSPEDLEAFAADDPEGFTALINRVKDDGTSSISKAQFDKIKNSGKLTNTQRQNTTANSKTALITGAVKGPTPDLARAARIMSNASGDDVANLGADILTRNEMIDTYDVNHLSAIMAKQKLKPNDRQIIMSRLTSNSSQNPNFQAISNWLQKNKDAAAYWGM